MKLSMPSRNNLITNFRDYPLMPIIPCTWPICGFSILGLIGIPMGFLAAILIISMVSE